MQTNCYSLLLTSIFISEFYAPDRMQILTLAMSFIYCETQQSLPSSQGSNHRKAAHIKQIICRLSLASLSPSLCVVCWTAIYDCNIFCRLYTISRQSVGPCA